MGKYSELTIRRTLRNSLMLSSDVRVASHRLGYPGEGDDGVTIATLYWKE